jgi:hypothetical protein
METGQRALLNMDEHRTRPAEGPQSLGNVVSRLIALRGYGQTGAQRQLALLWKDAAGAEISRRTKVLGVRNGTLLIGVGNSALLSELTAFHRHELLQKVRDADHDGLIRDLKFRLRGDLSVDEQP